MSFAPPRGGNAASPTRRGATSCHGEKSAVAESLCQRSPPAKALPLSLFLSRRFYLDHSSSIHRFRPLSLCPSYYPILSRPLSALALACPPSTSLFLCAAAARGNCNTSSDVEPHAAASTRRKDLINSAEPSSTHSAHSRSHTASDGSSDRDRRTKRVEQRIIAGPLLPGRLDGSNVVGVLQSTYLLSPLPAQSPTRRGPDPVRLGLA